MLDFIVQGFVLLVIAGGSYYVGRNRDWAVAHYSFLSFLPDWTRKETP